MFEALTFIPYELGMDLAFYGAMAALWGATLVGFLTCAKTDDGMCA